MAEIFNTAFVEAKFTVLRSNVQTYLQELYSKANEVFSPASPYGHVLTAVEMIFHVQLASIKNIVNQYDLSNPDNLNERTIRTLATLAGHNPVRAQSASGTLKLQLTPGISINEEIQGGKITIINRSKIRNKTNNLDYYMDLGTDFTTYYLDSGVNIFLPIVQGTIEFQVFTGNGLKNQTFIAVVPLGRNIEHNIIIVSVNGEVWSKRESLWDMLPLEKAYYAKTGFNGGLEIWFGNDNFGQIIAVGAQVKVQYVVTNGADGNLPQNSPNDWSFVDDIYDGNGEVLDIENLFFTFIENEISFGANAESIEFTKAIIPYTSRNFVLARPEQFEYHLRRLNIFSQINAYTTEKGTAFDDGNPIDDSIVYLFLVPDFRNFLNSGSNNYFDLPENVFTLDNYEKNKVITYLNTQGVVAIGTGIKIIQPVISKYVINVVIRVFENFAQSDIRKAVIETISNYFIETTRRDRIPKSDLIREIEAIQAVDSVSVEFISQLNEAYHLEFEIYKTSILRSNPTADPALIIMPGFDPTKSIGLDPKLGDIVIEKDQLVIIRGGFSDRYAVYYDFAPKDRGFGAVNINIEETVSRRLNV
jgi:hypothetical protein